MTLLSIPDMNCGHCKAAVTAALATVPDTGDIIVDLGARTAAVEDDASVSALLTALKSAGYPAQVVGPILPS